MNIRAIAKASGVSVATVSRVLNNESGVSEELRRKTLAVIEGKGYRPRENVRRGTRIGVVAESGVPAFDSFFSQVFTGVAQYAFEQGAETSLLFYTPRSRGGSMSLAEMLRKKRCNGAVLMSPLRDEEDADSLRAARIPTVLVASRTDVPDIGYIDCDSLRGATEQTEYLLRLGHRRIGFLCGPLDRNIDHRERLDGYLKAMHQAGVDMPPGWVVAHQPTAVTEQAGFDQAKTLLGQHPEVTAIFATNDAMAYGAIAACVEAGLRVPEDISVVGYDDQPTSKFYTPSLTTTRQPLRDMAYDAAQWVDLRLKGRLEELPRKTINGDLIVRRSCAPAPR